MRAIAATLAAGVTALLSAAEPASVITIAQQDAARSYLDAASASLSAEGRYVAFTSHARLVPADTNEHTDIYVLDRTDGRVTLESSGDSDHPSISGDGRFVVFETGSKVTWVDRVQDIRRALADGTQPSISADGRFVVFASGDEVQRLEVSTGVSLRVSEGASGARPSGGASVTPSVSGNGRFVAFTSTAQLTSTPERPLSHPAGRALAQVYVRDMEAGTTVRLGGDGRQPDGSSWAPAISGDGRYVAFVSAATNLVPADRNQSPDVFLASLQDGGLQLVSRGVKAASGNGPSSHPAISADGRFVAFQSTASDLVCPGRCEDDSEDINLLWDVFLFDRDTRSIAYLSGDGLGRWMEASTGPALDGAGKVVAFSSRHPVNASDTKNDFDLFVITPR